MPILNPFATDAFDMVALTAAINKIPNTYGRLEQLNLMPPQGVRLRTIIIEEMSGVLNLLPIPLLDGGHLMYYSVEIIKGSPVSERAMELGQRVGLALLIFIMAFAFYNDLNRLLTG